MGKSLQNYFDDYIAHCDNVVRLRPATLRGYKEVFRHFTNLMPEVTSPDMIDMQVMTHFLTLLNTRKRIVGKGEVRVGVKPSTTMTYWSKLNSFFKWLVVTGYMDKNPLTKMRPVEPDYSDKKSLSKSDIEKIYTAVTLHSKNSLLQKRDTAILSIFIFTGLRLSELLGLRVIDVDLTKKIITVRGETSKSKKTRQLHINASLVLHLQDYMKSRIDNGNKTEMLFASGNKDSGFTHAGMKHWVKRLVKLSGVNFHVHRFRHTFACNLARGGAGVMTLQRAMGHTDLRMTQRYLRSLDVEDMRDDMEKLSIENLG